MKLNFYSMTCIFSFSVLVSVVDITVVLLLLCARADVGFVSADVLRLFFDVLFDEGVVRKEVFLQWASAAALQGRVQALNSAGGFFSRLHEPESSISPPTPSWPSVSEEKSLWSRHSRTPAEVSKHRAHSL